MSAMDMIHSMKQMGKEALTKVTGTELEKKIAEACSNKPWGASTTMLSEIAQSTYDYQEYPVVMAAVWKRVNESGKNWRIVYKALTLLEYLIRNGSERAVEDGRSPPVEDAPLALGPSSPRPARPACRSHVPQSAAPAARPLVAGLRFAR